MSAGFPDTTQGYDFFDVLDPNWSMGDEDEELKRAEEERRLAEAMSTISTEQIISGTPETQQGAFGGTSPVGEQVDPDEWLMAEAPPSGTPKPSSRGIYGTDADMLQTFSTSGKTFTPVPLNAQEEYRQHHMKNVAQMQILLEAVVGSEGVPTPQKGESIYYGFHGMSEEDQIKSYNLVAAKYGPQFAIKSMKDIPWVDAYKEGKEEFKLSPETWGDVWDRTFTERGMNKLMPFWRYGYGSGHFNALWESAERIDQDTDTWEDWFRLHAATQDMIMESRGKTAKGWAAEIGKEIIPLMMEYIVGRGAVRKGGELALKKMLMKGGKELTKEALEEAVKKGGAKGFAAKLLGARMLGEGATGPTLLKKALQRMSGRAAYKAAEKVTTKRLKREIAKDFGMWFAKNAWESFAVTSTWFQGKNLEGTIQRMVPGIQITSDELGRLRRTIVQPSPDFFEAYRYAFTDTYIEIFSEDTGQIIGRISPSIVAGAKKVGTAALRRMPLKFHRFLKMHVIAKTARALRMSLGDTLDWLNEHGWHGPVGEMFEERFADFVRAGSKEFGFVDTGEWSDIIPSKEQLIGEAGAFLFLGGSAQAVTQGPRIMRNLFDLSRGGSEAQHQQARDLLGQQLSDKLIDQTEYSRKMAKYNKPSVDQRVQGFIDSDGSRTPWDSLPDEVRQELVRNLKHFDPELEAAEGTDPAKGKTSKEQRVFMRDLLANTIDHHRRLEAGGEQALRDDELEVYEQAQALRYKGRDDEAEALLSNAGVSEADIQRRGGAAGGVEALETNDAIDRQEGFWRKQGFRPHMLLDIGRSIGLESEFAVYRKDKAGHPSFDEDATRDKLVERLREMARVGILTWKLSDFSPTINPDFASLLGIPNRLVQLSEGWTDPSENDVLGRTPDEQMSELFEHHANALMNDPSAIEGLYRNLFPDGDESKGIGEKTGEILELYRQQLGEHFDEVKAANLKERIDREAFQADLLKSQEDQEIQKRREQVNNIYMSQGENPDAGNLLDLYAGAGLIELDHFHNHVATVTNSPYAKGADGVLKFALDSASNNLYEPRKTEIGGRDMFGELQADPANPSQPALYVHGDRTYAVKRPSLLLHDFRSRYFNPDLGPAERELVRNGFETDMSSGFIVDEYVTRGGKTYSVSDSAYPISTHPLTGEAGVIQGKPIERGASFQSVAAAKSYIDHQIEARKQDDLKRLVARISTEEDLKSLTKSEMETLWRTAGGTGALKGVKHGDMVDTIISWQKQRDVEDMVEEGYEHGTHKERLRELSGTANSTRPTPSSEQSRRGQKSYSVGRELKMTFADGKAKTVPIGRGRTGDAITKESLSEMIAEEIPNGLTSVRIVGDWVISKSQQEANEGKGQGQDRSEYSLRVWTKSGIESGEDLTKEEKASRKRIRKLGEQAREVMNRGWERIHYPEDRETVENLIWGSSPPVPRVPVAVSAQGDAMYEEDIPPGADVGTNRVRATDERPSWLVTLSPSRPERVKKLATNRAGMRNAKRRSLAAGVSINDFEELWKTRRGRRDLAKKINEVEEIRYEVFERLATGPATADQMADFMTEDISRREGKDWEPAVTEVLELLVRKGWIGRRELPHKIYGSVGIYVLPEAELFNTLSNSFVSTDIAGLDLAVKNLFSRRSVEKGFQNRHDWLTATRSLDPRVWRRDGTSVILHWNDEVTEVAREAGVPARTVMSFLFDEYDKANMRSENPSLGEWANTDVGVRFKWLIAKHKSGHDVLNWQEIDQQYGTQFDWKYQHRRGQQGLDYFVPVDDQGGVEITHLVGKWIQGSIEKGELGADLANNAVAATRLALDTIFSADYISTTSLAPSEVIQNAAKKAHGFYIPASSGLDMEVYAAVMQKAYLAEEQGPAADDILTQAEQMGAEPIEGPSELRLRDEGDVDLEMKRRKLQEIRAAGPQAWGEFYERVAGWKQITFEEVDAEVIHQYLDRFPNDDWTPTSGWGPDPIEGPSASGVGDMTLSEEREPRAGKAEDAEHPIEVIKWADKVFGVTTRYRRFSHKQHNRVAGLYFGIGGYDLNTLAELDEIDYAHPAVIRLLRGFESSFPVYTHELAHHVDQTARVEMAKLVKAGVLPFEPDTKQFLGGMANQLLMEGAAGQQRWDEMEKELKQLDYLITQSVAKGKEKDWEEHGRLSEGFAEYMRLWLTAGETEAVKAAPKFHVWFHVEYPKFFPEFHSNLGRLRIKAARWSVAGWERRIDASIRPPKTAPLLPWQRFRTFIDDELNVLRRIEEKLLAQDDAPFIPVGDRPYTLARVLHKREGAMAWDAVTNGVRSLIGYGGRLSQPLTESLALIGAVDTKQFRSFIHYAVSKHAIDVWADGKHPGIELQDAENAVAFHEGSGDKTMPEGYGEAWKKAQAGITRWSKAHIEMMAEVGLLDNETRDIMIAKYDHYIPLARVLDNLEEQGITTGFLDVTNPVGRLRGSAHQILDPLTAMMHASTVHHASAIKHLVATKLIDAAERVKAHGWAVFEVDTPKEFANIKVSDIEPIIKSLGWDTKGLTDEQLNKVFSVIVGMGQHHNTDSNVARVVRNGKLKWYEFDHDLWQSIQQLSKPGILDNATARMLLMPLEVFARAKRIGATSARLTFLAITNPGKDIQEHIFKTEGHVPIGHIKRASLMPLESKDRNNFAQWLVEAGLITEDERLEISNKELHQYDKDNKKLATHTTEEGIKAELVRRIMARQMMNPDWNPLSWAEMGINTLMYDAAYAKTLYFETMSGFVDKPHAGKIKYDSLGNKVRDKDGNIKVEFLVDEAGKERKVNRADIMIELFRRYGGVMSTYMGQDLESAYTTAAKLEQLALNSSSGVVKNGIRFLAHPAQYLSALNEKLLKAQEMAGVMEVGPRLDEMDKALRKHGYTAEDLAYGKVPIHVQIEMMLLANTSTIDFSRGGTIARLINRYSAFYNVAIQSPIQAKQKMFNRDGKINLKHLARMVRRGFMAFSVFTIQNWYRNRDEEWWKEIPARDRLGWWFVKVPGLDEPIAIPRLYDVGFIFGSLVEASLDSWYNADDKAMRDLATAVAKEYHVGSVDGWLWEMVPDGLLLWWELSTPRGYDHWRERTLLTEAQMDFAPEDRFNEYTTEVAMLAGEATGTSPVKWDKAIKEGTGSVGTDLLQGVEEMDARRTVGTTRFWRTGGYGQSIDEFYKMHEASKFAINKYPRDPKTKKRVGVPMTESDQWWWLETHKDIMGQLGKVIKKKRKAPDEEKKQYQALKTGLSRRAMGKTPFMQDFPDIFLLSNLPDDVKVIRDGEIRDRLYDLTNPVPGGLYWQKQLKSGKTHEAVTEQVKEKKVVVDRAKRFMHPSLTRLNAKEAFHLMRKEIVQRGGSVDSGEAAIRFSRLREYMESR